MKTSSLLFASAASLLFALLLALFIAVLVMNRHPVSGQAMAKVKVGTTAEEAASLLGKPASIETKENGETRWRHSGFCWCIVEVVFNGNDEVVELIHDH